MFRWRKRGWQNLQNVLPALYCCLFWLGLLPVCFCQAPPNDNFTNAVVLEGNAFTFSGSLTNATFEPTENSFACHAFPGGSVWWSWTATNSTVVVVDMIDSTGSEYAGLSVNTGKEVASLAELDCTGLDIIPNRYIRFAASSGTTYYIRASGQNRSFTFRLTATNAPIVLAPPQSRTVAETASVMFGVVAGGIQPLQYQWLFVGSPLSGQTAPTLVLHYLAANRAGDYSVIVSNSSGVVTSAVATLTVSPSPALLLATVPSPDTNVFSFNIAGELGQSYRVWASTNLLDWVDEESLTPDPGRPAVVRNTNAISVYSIPMTPNQKFLRASHFMNTEICIAQLMAIKHAVRFWAIETRRSVTAVVTASDIFPYLNGEPACPSGGTSFADSYVLTDVITSPACQKVPQTHKLPP